MNGFNFSIVILTTIVSLLLFLVEVSDIFILSLLYTMAYVPIGIIILDNIKKTFWIAELEEILETLRRNIND